jgi:vesicle transport through interaction with t-SNAREs protein 1
MQLIRFIDSIIHASVDVEGELSEAQGFLKAMEVHSSNMKGDKRSVSQKVKDYKEEYTQLVQNYKSTKSQAEQFAVKSGSASRSKLLNSNQKLDQTTVVLEQSRNILHQTEQVGNTVINDLESQKEQLVHAQGKVKETKQFTMDAKSILQLMGTRAVMHKICVWFTILVLAIIIGVILYYGVIAKKKK